MKDLVNVNTCIFTLVLNLYKNLPRVWSYFVHETPGWLEHHFYHNCSCECNLSCPHTGIIVLVTVSNSIFIMILIQISSKKEQSVHSCGYFLSFTDFIYLFFLFFLLMTLESFISLLFICLLVCGEFRWEAKVKIEGNF